VEVWVLRDRDYAAARAVVDAFNEPVDAPDWTCQACGKSSPATFETCWACAEPRPQ
jgi:hypothetical protein